MATKDPCYCGCGQAASRTSPFRAQHAKRWVEQLANDSLPDAIEGRDYAHVLAPHEELLAFDGGFYQGLFRDLIEKRVKIARRGWVGQSGEVLNPLKVSWLMRRLRAQFWTGQDVTHDDHGLGRVWKIVDQAVVRVRFFDDEVGTLDVPTAELRRIHAADEDEDMALGLDDGTEDE